MQKLLLGSLCLTIGLLSACGPQMTTLSELESLDNSNSSLKVQTPAEKSLEALENDLRAGQVSASTSSIVSTKAVSVVASKVSLTEAQIQTILASVQSALTKAQLNQSTDLQAVLTTLIAGASSGANLAQSGSTLNLPNLLSVIGNSALSSLVNLSPDAISTADLKVLSQAIFANLGTAGVSSSVTGEVSGVVIQALLTHVASTDIDSAGFTSVIQSIAQGAITGLGSNSKGSIGNMVFQTALKGLGSGSLSGIASLVSSLGNSRNSADLLKNFVNAFTVGSQYGVTSLSSSTTLNSALLSAVLAGLNSSASNNTNSGNGNSSPSWVSTLVSNVVPALVNVLLKSLIL